MLEELDQNEMFEAQKHKLSIHHSNLFHPTPLGIVGLAWGVNEELLSVMKRYIDSQDSKQSTTIIEIYRIRPGPAPKLQLTLLEYEELTGIVWVDTSLILTVSKEQTINIYDSKSALKVSSTITDYGPILCMKYSAKKKLLLTGTGYGYVAAYKICSKNLTIEFLSKMVKITNQIHSLDFSLKHCEVVELPKKTIPVNCKPGKRKRALDSDSDSDNDDKDENQEEEFSTSVDLTIFGASGGDVVVWDYHRKSIAETIRVGSSNVLSILALNNGDIVVGDSEGTVSIFDHVSFTRKQSIKAAQSGILCLAKDSMDRCIVVSGRDPTIVILKQNGTTKSDYLFFEKVEIHTHDVTSIVLLGRKEFFTGALDGILMRFRVTGKTGGKSLEKHITLPHYSNNIKFFDQEMMIQYNKSLVIWKLPKLASTSASRKSTSSQEVEMKPVKLLLIKARTFIHSSTFSNSWISYSTKRGVHMFSRSNGKLKSYRPDKKLPDCNALELCCNGRYLAVSAQRFLHIIDLSERTPEPNYSKDEEHSLAVVAEQKLKSIPRNLLYSESLDQLVVACGPSNSHIYSFDLNSIPGAGLNRVVKFSVKNHDILFVTHNRAVKRDTSIYVYTTNDKIVKLDLTKQPDDGEMSSEFNKADKIRGLPEDSNILGMVMVSRDSCILYDSHRMFKVDMTTNEIINQNSNYNYIIRMDNFVFNKADQVALVELTPDDYVSSLPPINPRRRFGK